MSSNIEKVQMVAQALGEIREQVVFVGGSIAELYAKNPELSDIRPTIDVDCVVNLVSYLEYGKLEEHLRKLGFQNDTSEGAPICRKIHNGIFVDFMPVNPNILGFGNMWYKSGIESKISIVLPNDVSIFILPVEYYVATKMEAMRDRGGEDIRGSHDWEDIVYILENCETFLQNFQDCNDKKLKTYLSEKFGELVKRFKIKDEILCVLPYNSDEERVNEVLDLMKKITF
jgi:predicted nucleotidyltransferase